MSVFSSCSSSVKPISVHNPEEAYPCSVAGTIWAIMCSDELIPKGTQINQTGIHRLILSRSLLYPPPPIHSCYYGIIEVYGRGKVDETCNLTEREVECVIRRWGGAWGNDHQQNENKWIVIPQEEIYPHLFLVPKSVNWLAMESV